MLRKLRTPLVSGVLAICINGCLAPVHAQTVTLPATATATINGVAVPLTLQLQVDISGLVATPPAAVPVPVPIVIAPVATVPVATTPVLTPFILMTAAHPLNQPATQYPAETRSLLSSATGDHSYILRPIDDTWHKVFGPNHIHFSVSMPWVTVDSSKTPNIFADLRINYPQWISDDGATCAPMSSTATRATHWPVLAAHIEPGDAGSDGHTIILDTHTNLLYETQFTRLDNAGNYSADASRCWHAAQPEIGTPGQNSANAAGLPVLPFILRYDEAASGAIKHAVGVTFSMSRSGPNGPYYTTPASHGAGENWSAMTWPGQRMLLRPDYPETGLSAINVAILRAWKTYGLVNNDNGITGVVTTDLDPRWNGDDLAKMGDAMTLNDFVLVNSGPVVDSEGAQAK